MSPILHEVMDLLRQLDDEATTVRDGSPTGLSWYGGHAKPDQSRPQTEPCWSRRLAALLRQRDHDATAELAYPDIPRARCDLVVRTPDGACWIEIKGAWREYWRKQGGLAIYRSYLLHPLVDGLVEKSHTVPNDIEKLATLSRDDAHTVASLLVGFDADDHPMNEDVEALIERASLREPAWATPQEQWPDPYRPGEHVRCWCWSRVVMG